MFILKFFGNVGFTRQDTCAYFWHNFARFGIVMAGLKIILGDVSAESSVLSVDVRAAPIVNWDYSTC